MEKQLSPFSYTVYLDDTDALGMVYHANYLKIAERARTYAFSQMGIYHHRMMDAGMMFVVKECQIHFHAPAHLADELTVQTTLIHMGAASLKLTQHVFKGKELLVTLELTLVLISTHLKVIRLSKDLKELFSQDSNPSPL